MQSHYLCHEAREKKVLALFHVLRVVPALLQQSWKDSQKRDKESADQADAVVDRNR